MRPRFFLSILFESSFPLVFGSGAYILLARRGPPLFGSGTVGPEPPGMSEDSPDGQSRQAFYLSDACPIWDLHTLTLEGPNAENLRERPAKDTRSGSF